MDYNELYNYPHDVKLDMVYNKLSELTDCEENEKQREYNEFLLDSLQDCISYIHRLEKKIPKPDISLEEIEKINNNISVKKRIYPDKFVEKCVQLNVPWTEINTNITQDVKEYLDEMAEKNNCTIHELLRDMIDYSISNNTD